MKHVLCAVNEACGRESQGACVERGPIQPTALTTVTLNIVSTINDTRKSLSQSQCTIEGKK